MKMNGISSSGVAGGQYFCKETNSIFILLITDPGPTDVKYPPNVGRGLSSADLEVDRLYEPKQNKKIVRYFSQDTPS